MRIDTPINFKANILKEWELIVGLVIILIWLVGIFLLSEFYWLFILPFFLLLFWQLNLVFAEIILTNEGVTYKSWFRHEIIGWSDIKTLRGIARIKRQFFEVISLQALKADIAYESQIDNLFYGGDVKKQIYISSKDQFNPTRFTLISNHYIYFEYRAEILKIIQEKLEAIDKNV